VQEAILWLPVINKGSLNGPFDVAHPALVNIPDACRGRGSLGEQIFKSPVSNDGDPALFARDIVDEHDLAL
jgi:hypothetical protein